jgi:invasion protein IalB
MGFDKGYHSVTMRLDSNTAVTTRWSVSADKEALFYIGDEQDFLRELMSAKTLVLRSEKYNGSYRTISFDLTGLENAIEPYRSVYGLD